MIARWRWVWDGEQLDGPSAAPTPPRTSLRFFLFSRDELGTVEPGSGPSAKPVDTIPLYRYVAIPESLPVVTSSHPRQSLARPDRSNFWRWFFTPETLPQTGVGAAGAVRSHAKES